MSKWSSYQSYYNTKKEKTKSSTSSKTNQSKSSEPSYSSSSKPSSSVNSWEQYKRQYSKKQNSEYNEWDNYKYFTYTDKQGMTKYERDQLQKEIDKEQKDRDYSNPKNPYNQGQIWNKPVSQEHGYQHDPLYYTHTDIDRHTNSLMNAGLDVPEPEILKEKKKKDKTYNPLYVFGNLLGGLGHGIANAGKSLTDKKKEGFGGELKSAAYGLIKGAETSLHPTNISPEYEQYRGSFIDMFRNLQDNRYEKAKERGWYLDGSGLKKFGDGEEAAKYLKKDSDAVIGGVFLDMFADPIDRVSGVGKAGKQLAKGSKVISKATKADDVVKATGKTMQELTSMDFNDVRKLIPDAKQSKDVAEYVEHFKQADRLIDQSPKAKYLTSAEKLKEAETLVNKSIKKAGYIEPTDLKFAGIPLVKSERLTKVGDQVSKVTQSKTAKKVGKKVTDKLDEPFEMWNTYFGGMHNQFNLPMKRAKREKNILEIIQQQNLKDNTRFAKNIEKSSDLVDINMAKKMDKTAKKTKNDTKSILKAKEDRTLSTEDITKEYATLVDNPDYPHYKDKKTIELQQDYHKLSVERNVAKKTLDNLNNDLNKLKLSDPEKAKHTERILENQDRIARLTKEQELIDNIVKSRSDVPITNISSADKANTIDSIADTLTDSNLKIELNEKDKQHIRNLTKETPRDKLIKKRGDSIVAFTEPKDVKLKNVDTQTDLNKTIKNLTTDIKKGSYNVEDTIGTIKDSHKKQSIIDLGYDVFDEKSSLPKLKKHQLNREIEDKARETLNAYHKQYGKDLVIKRMDGKYPRPSKMTPEQNTQLIKRLTVSKDRKKILTDWYIEADKAANQRALNTLAQNKSKIEVSTNQHFGNIIRKQFKEADDIDKANILDAFGIDDIDDLSITPDMSTPDYEEAYRTFSNKTRITSNQRTMIKEKYGTTESMTESFDNFRESKKKEIVDRLKKDIPDVDTKSLNEQLKNYVKSKDISNPSDLSEKDLEALNKIRDNFNDVNKGLEAKLSKQAEKEIANLIRADTVFDMPKEYFSDFLKMKDNDLRKATNIELKTLRDMAKQVGGDGELESLNKQIKALNADGGVGFTKEEYNRLNEQYRAMKSNSSKVPTRDYTSDEFLSLSKEEQVELLKQDQLHDANLTGDLTDINDKSFDYHSEDFLAKPLDEQVEIALKEQKITDKGYKLTGDEWQDTAEIAMQDLDLKMKEKAITGKEATRASELFNKSDGISNQLKKLNEQIKTIPKDSDKFKQINLQRTDLLIEKGIVQKEYDLIAKLNTNKINTDLSEFRRLSSGYQDYLKAYSKFETGDTSKAVKEVLSKNVDSYNDYLSKHKLYEDLIKYNNTKQSSLSRYFDKNGKVKESLKEALHMIVDTKNKPENAQVVPRIINSLENPTTAYEIKKANQIAEHFSTSKQTYTLSNGLANKIAEIQNPQIRERVLKAYDKFKHQLDRGKLISKDSATKLINTAYNDPDALDFNGVFKNADQPFKNFVNEEYFVTNFKTKSSDMATAVEKLEKNVGGIKYEYSKNDKLNFLKIELGKSGTNFYIEEGDRSVNAAKKMMAMYDNQSATRANKAFLKDMDVYVLNSNNKVPDNILGAYKDGKAVIFDISDNPKYTFLHESGHNMTKKLTEVFGNKTYQKTDNVIKNFKTDANNLVSKDYSELFSLLHSSDMLTNDYKSSLDLEELFKAGFPSKYAKIGNDEKLFRSEAFAEIIAMSQSNPMVSRFFKDKMPETTKEINKLLNAMNSKQVESFSKSINLPFIQNNTDEIKRLKAFETTQLESIKDIQLAASLTNAGMQKKVMQRAEEKMEKIRYILQNENVMKDILTTENFSPTEVKQVQGRVKNQNKLREFLKTEELGKLKNKSKRNLKKLDKQVDDSMKLYNWFDEGMKKAGFEEGIYQDASNLEIEEIKTLMERYVPHQLTPGFKKDPETAKILGQLNDNKTNLHVNQSAKTRKVKDPIHKVNAKYPKFFEEYLPKVYIDRMLEHNTTMYAETFQNEFFAEFATNIKDFGDYKIVENMLNDDYVLMRKGKTGEFKRGLMLDDVSFDAPGTTFDSFTNYASALTPDKNFQVVDIKDIDVKKYLEVDSDNIMLVRKDMYKVYESEMLKQFNGDKKTFFSKAVNIYDQITNRVFKPLATVVNPTFHVTNMIGNEFTQYLAAGAAAFNPKHNLDAATLLMGGKIGGKNKKILGRSIDELTDALKAYGVLDTGYYTRDMVDLKPGKNLKKIANQVSVTDLPIAKQLESTGNFIESQAKVNLFLTEVGSGKSFQEAADSVHKYLFDYSDLTTFEKEKMKRLIPFYTFMRKNVPLQFQTMFEKPARLKRYHRLKRDIARDSKETEDQKLFKPDYLEDAVYLGNDKYINIQTPADDINAFTPKEMFSMLNPMLKLAYEIPANKNVYFDDKIKKGAENTAAAPFYLQPFAQDTPKGKRMDPYLRYAARNLMPGAESWSMIAQKALSKGNYAPELSDNEERRIGGYLTGVKQYTFGKEQTDRAKKEEAKDYIQLLQDHVNAAWQKGYIK